MARQLHRTYLLIAAILVSATGCGTQGEATLPAREQRESLTTAQAHYLANAGVLITRGETKIVFDPLFRNDFGTYQLLPETIERALFAGEPPFDGLDAVLISHHHEDHFSPVDILRLMLERPDLHLYAPAQAVDGMRSVATEAHQEVFGRVREIALAYQDAPIVIEGGDLLIEAVRIPHSGWPDSRTDVENIAFRVTLDEETTVVHLGDADTNDSHYAHDAEYWLRRDTDIAFPPYWFLQSDEGRQVLERRLRPAQTVGVHVPAQMPTRAEERPELLRNDDLFQVPGETRDIQR